MQTFTEWRQTNDIQEGAVAALLLVAQLAMQSVVGMLPRDIQADMPDIQVVSAQNVNIARSGVVTQAWVKQGDRTIYIADWTDNYRKAMKGNTDAQVALAADIAHEWYHIMNGTGTDTEAGAYDKQIEVLKAHHASSSSIKGIERAKAYVTR